MWLGGRLVLRLLFVPLAWQALPYVLLASQAQPYVPLDALLASQEPFSQEPSSQGLQA